MTNSKNLSRRDFIKAGSAAAIGFMLLDNVLVEASTKDSRPNILWITSEDNSAYFTHCYGNNFATTPNIDKLAKEGFLYTHAYSVSPVCAPARNSILTGVYAASNGNENMRSNYAKSKIVKTYPEFLREAGYYCTNNSKTDYNTSSVASVKIWDESSDTAHYKNRPKGEPFFAVFNLMTSHESRILPFFPQPPPGQLKHKPEEVTLPPYHPDTPEMRHDWALYYDLIGVMDAEVGNLLRDLEESGEADNTIVMYYGDNGGVLARSKRFVYETGTQVPFIVRIPEKYKHLYPAQKPGQKIDRLINFTDLAPTLLSVLDEHIPAYMQGKAFLGKQATQAPEYTFLTRQRMDERYDLVRAVRDQQFRYIRNYMPFRITMQHVNFMFQALSTQSWEKAFRHGKANTVQSRDFKPKPVEELYNTENDPWEVNNLAADPAYKGVLIRMRSALRAWMMEIRDVGLIPETEYASIAGDVPLYDYMRSPACPFDKLMEASEKAVMGGQEDINTYVTYLKDKNSAIRYWGATGLLILKDGARPAVTALRKASSDPSGAVATLAAEALYGLGEEEIALKAFKNILQNPAIHDDNDATFAMNSIDALNIDNPAIETAVKDFLDRQSSTNIDSQKAPGVPGEGNAYRGDAYPVRIGKYLLQKWEKKE